MNFQIHIHDLMIYLTFCLYYLLNFCLGYMGICYHYQHAVF